MFKNIFRAAHGGALLLAEKESAMPYPSGHAQRTRARIVRSAMVLFNRHGLESVSIDDVMAHARLTRGGFYRHFKAKNELYAEAIALSLAETPWSRWDGIAVDFSANDAAAQVVRAYLSTAHFDDVDGSCPTVALPSDVARSDPRVKRAFENVFRAMVGLFERSLGRGPKANRQRALAIAGICVGGMVVARAVEHSDLADALRTATLRTALELGGWSKRGLAAVRRKPLRRRKPT
jgi:AcrR family transcriptional regulator